MLRRLVQNPALADDLHQETLALVIEKIRRDEVREPEKLAGLHPQHGAQPVHRRSAQRGALPGSRRGRRRAGGPAPTLSGRGPAPLERVLAEEEARQVQRLLGELRYDRDRQLLLRFYLSDAQQGGALRRSGDRAGAFPPGPVPRPRAAAGALGTGGEAAAVFRRSAENCGQDRRRSRTEQIDEPRTIDDRRRQHRRALCDGPPDARGGRALRGALSRLPVLLCPGRGRRAPPARAPAAGRAGGGRRARRFAFFPLEPLALAGPGRGGPCSP